MNQDALNEGRDMININEVRERLERLADNAEQYGLRVLARPEHIRALLADHARLKAGRVDLEQFREALVALSDYAYERHGDVDHPHCVEADRLLALIDGRNVRSSSEHEICGGCGNGDPDKRYLGCLHDFGSKAGEVQP